MDKIVNLCLRRGILFPSNEIYGSMAGFFDYGPVGVELKKNIENNWWKFVVNDRDNIVGIDGALINVSKVWKASGHVDSFNDPLVECKKCHLRFRADQLIEEELKISMDGVGVKQLQELIDKHKIKCPKCGGDFTEVQVFNLMFKTHVGAIENDASLMYLRPETAQLIFTDFKRVLAVSRKKLPFGMAQIGKAFRNEISPRNFVFRSREFSQMELEFFINPEKMNDAEIKEDDLKTECFFYTQEMQEKNIKHEKMSFEHALEKKIIGTKWHAYWMIEFFKWFKSIGIKPENLRFRQHVKTELSHYSSETWDLDYNYPWGWKEVEGIANRTDFDLKQHSKFSGDELSFFDEKEKKKIIPFVIEPSTGVERTLLTVLIDAYSEREDGRVFLDLKASIAPVKIAVLPLMPKEELEKKARGVFDDLKNKIVCDYDSSGSIGKRYSRFDEIGTPFAVTIDYQTLEDDTVTLRYRNDMRQERIKISGLSEKMKELIDE
ncbi:MAG: glycine--tRNA ligase [Candidatus Marsarchaeota archaeon]|nr:glycine--tRNA ligase [Candidatus Marsarchaeota archaeon]